MLDAIVVIVGFYFLIKFIFENKKTKEHRAQLEQWARDSVKLQNELTNYELEKKYNTAVKYKVLREELGIPVLTRVLPGQNLAASGFLGEHEAKYQADKSYGERGVVNWRIEAMYAAIKLSELGYVPRAWFFTSGMPLGVYTCHGVMIKEAIAVAKQVQENLKKNGKHVHVCLIDMNRYDSGTPRDKYEGHYVCIQETCSRADEAIRVDEISY